MRYTRGSFAWDFRKILVLLGALWDFKGLDNLITLLSFDQLRAETCDLKLILKSASLLNILFKKNKKK